jgi:hypothetical protein
MFNYFNFLHLFFHLKKTQYDGLTLLSHLGNMTWQNIGIDYVSSEDILPYTSTEKLPIENELFSKFLMQDSESSISIIINFLFMEEKK